MYLIGALYHVSDFKSIQLLGDDRSLCKKITTPLDLLRSYVRIQLSSNIMVLLSSTKSDLF